MSGEMWVWSQQPTGESFACINEGRQLVAGGMLKPADLFEGWLGQRGGVSCGGPR